MAEKRKCIRCSKEQSSFSYCVEIADTGKCDTVRSEWIFAKADVKK